MNRIGLGVTVLVLAMVSAGVGACVSRGAAPPADGAAAQDAEPAQKPGRIKLDCGVDVTPLEVKWLEGEWQALPDLLMKDADKKRIVTIERTAGGEYVLTSDPPTPKQEARLIVFRADCYRLVQITMKTPTGAPSVLYAVLNGHSYRLSLDIVPAMFPQAWKSKKLIEAVGAKRADEVPVEKRLAALVTAANLIDEIGTLMHHDMTYIRPLEEEP